METAKKNKKTKIAHIIQPAIIEQSSDLFVAQPITFETMKIAQKLAQEQVDVTLYYTKFSDENISMAKEFQATRVLDRSILDISASEHKRKLPLIKDILDRLYEENDADYLIYTNVDIALMPYFYLMVNQFIKEGYDGFIINRRTISSKHTTLEHLPLMFAEIGKSHPGCDCFVFKRSLYPQFCLGHVNIGTSLFGLTMRTNVATLAQHFIHVKNLHLTFHIGDDRVWRQTPCESLHNIRELEQIFSQLFVIPNLPHPKTLFGFHQIFLDRKQQTLERIDGDKLNPLIPSLRRIHNLIKRVIVKLEGIEDNRINPLYSSLISILLISKTFVMKIRKKLLKHT